MEDLILQINRWIPSKRIFIRAYSAGLVLIGLTYIILQYARHGYITDSLFTGLLFGGSFILLFGIRRIQKFFIERTLLFYENLDSSKRMEFSEFEKLLRRIFENTFIVISGIIYGLLVGYVPFLLNIWGDDLLLKYLLSLFLFVVNFLTGASLFSLIMLFIFLFRTSDHILVSLFDRYNYSTEFITELARRASLIASLYIAFCITSIYFSELPINSLTVGYSIFAGIIILFAYIVPMIPIRNRIIYEKKLLLNEISASLQKELDEIMENSKTGKEFNTKKFKSLLELKSTISIIQTIPIGFKALWNSVYIILITLLPVFIQIILEILIK